MNGRGLAKTAFGLVIIHFILNMAHGWAHEDKSVPVTAAMYAFIIPVIIIGPFVAGWLIWKGKDRGGYALLALTMAGSFFFGLAYHFLIQGPDHVNHVQGGVGASVFFWTSVALALIEAVGAAFGAWAFTRSSSPGSGQALDVTA